MKKSPQIFSFFFFILSVIVACFAVASVVHSDEPYYQSMDLVPPDGDSYNAYQRRWMNEAWELTHDKEFLYMLKAENGLLNHDRRHDPSQNMVGVDWGFCGTNDVHNATVRNDPRFMSDPLWQLGECYRMFKGGTAFHAYKRVQNEPEFRKTIESHFIFF